MITGINELKFESKHFKIAKKDILNFIKNEAKRLELGILDTYKFITHMMTSHELLGDVGRIKESLRGSRQTLMMKGMPRGRNSIMVQGADGDGLGELDLDDPEELEELSFTGSDVSMVRTDILNFLSNEYKKLNHKNPLDTYKFIQQILNSEKVYSKIKSIR